MGNRDTPVGNRDPNGERGHPDLTPRPPHSCGDHFNPDGECHGGPEDEHRVSLRDPRDWWMGGGVLGSPLTPPICPIARRGPGQHLGGRRWPGRLPHGGLAPEGEAMGGAGGATLRPKSLGGVPSPCSVCPPGLGHHRALGGGGCGRGRPGPGLPPPVTGDGELGAKVSDGGAQKGVGGHTKPPPHTLCPPRLACGVVARAAGLFQNPKRVCSCDGVTLWDERDQAAPGHPPAPTPHL